MREDKTIRKSRQKFERKLKIREEMLKKRDKKKKMFEF